MTIDFREAFRIDLAASVPIKERLAQFAAKEGEAVGETAEEAAEETARQNGDAETKPHSHTNSSRVSAADIRAMYPNDAVKASRVIFVLKLCQALLETGHATIDAENHATNVSLALGLDAPRLELGPRRMMASFGPGPVHFLETRRDIVLFKLQDIVELTVMVVKGHTTDVVAATSVLDQIVEAPLPYGWLVVDIIYWIFSVLSAICAFFGSYLDMGIVGFIALAVLLVQHLVRAFPSVLGPLELLLASITSGIFSSIGWRYIIHPKHTEELCHMSVLFLSPLLIYLPGSDLIYGAYEIKMGQTIVGVSRLVAALVRCMYIALGVTIGWQFFGHGIVSEQGDTKAKASFVTSVQCIPFDSGVSPWWMVYGVYNLAYLFPALAFFNVRPRDLLGPYVIAILSLGLDGALHFACKEERCGLSSYIVNAIVVFFAANLASFYDYLTDRPTVAGVIPVILILAPGSSAVLELVGLMQQANGIAGTKTDVFTSLSLVGASYALGMFLAFAIWQPLLKRKQTSLDLRESVSSLFAMHGFDRF